MKEYLLIHSNTSVKRNSTWSLIKVSESNGKIIKKENISYKPNCRTNYSSLGWAQNAIIRDMHKHFGKDIIISKQLLNVIIDVAVYFTTLGNALIDLTESHLEEK